MEFVQLIAEESPQKADNPQKSESHFLSLETSPEPRNQKKLTEIDLGPLPSSEIGKRFCLFFPHRWSFIQADNNPTGKPEWETVKPYPLQHRNLWKIHQDPKRLIGLGFGSETNYGMLDIDRESVFHPANDEKAFKSLLGAYEEIGLNAPIIIQSSTSEGIHVYYFFPKPLPTFKIATLLFYIARNSGFSPKAGQLETFPNIKAYVKEGKPSNYKPHRLPLQQGSYLLDPDYQPYSNKIEHFINLVRETAAAQDLEQIERALEIAKQVHKNRRKLYPSKASIAIENHPFAEDLNQQIGEGWTSYGQTNDLLRLIGTHARIFEGLGGNSLAERIVERAQELPGYREYCRHQHNIQARARDWGRCIEKFYYPYGSQAQRVGTYRQMKKEARENVINSQRQEQARYYIQQAIEHIRKTFGLIPKKIGECKETLIKTIKTLFNTRPSDKTLYRHRELWHPQYIPTQDSQELTAEQEQNPEQAGIILETPNPASNTSLPSQQPQKVDPTPRNYPSNKKVQQQPELLPDNSFKPCHTPPVKDPMPTLPPNTPDSLQCKDFKTCATPPLYMKVVNWIQEKRIFVYRGLPASGLVASINQKYAQIKIIQTETLVVLEDCYHSSFLLHPEAESNLQVYVRPVVGAEEWEEGISVLAKNLALVTNNS